MSSIIPFCCLCSHVCIHNSVLMSNFDAKQPDIKSRAPFFIHFRKAASQEPPFRNGFRNTQNGDLSNNKGSLCQDVQEGAIFDGMSTKEGIVDDLTVDNEDTIYEEEYEVTVMEIDDL